MDKKFNGYRYSIFDGNPVKTLWEDGIIIKSYSLDIDMKELVQNDGLTYYIETEVSEKDFISKRAFLKYVDEKIKKNIDIKIIKKSIEDHKDTLDRLADL